MKKMLARILIAISCLASSSAFSTAIKTDFVFIIDATSSMSGEIAGVRNGFSNFVGGLNAADVDARFSIILYGGAPELVLDFTSDVSTAQTAFSQISTSGAVSGFQNNHNTNPEAGLEAIRIALGAATDSTLLRTNVGGTGGLTYRSDARTNLILVTDEDSDRPFYPDNRVEGQTSTEPPSTINAIWQAEVDATAQAIIDANAFINMLINVGDAPTKSQYGDYNKDVSDPDLLNWDSVATLENLLLDTATANSLQAQVLSSNKDLVARSFNVAGANDADFVNNFFAAKLEEVTQDDPCLIDPNSPACTGQQVPLPGTLALFGLGLFGLGAARRARLIQG
jgi:hypothetical protein